MVPLSSTSIWSASRTVCSLWAMTKVVLAVTFGMALFLGVLDYAFNWLLRGIVGQNLLFIILGVVVVAVLLGSAYLIGQGEEV